MSAFISSNGIRAGHGGGGVGSVRRGAGRFTAASVALWLFIGVATSLFSLFLMAYAMRMTASDWSPIAPPWQLWLSTALLIAGSILLQAASAAARTMQPSTLQAKRARRLLLAGGVCALAFLAVQLSAWQALQANHVMPVGNPAGSFFYLLTAMHGLHVAGGLVGWTVTARGARQDADPGRTALRIALCARYWHFLLAVWLVLFAALSWLTPAVVNFICGTN
jgi:cytochrome c oxidase subunit 3